MTPSIPENISAWLSSGASSPSWATRCRREIPTTMKMRTKKTKRTRTGTKNRRSSENPTKMDSRVLPGAKNHAGGNRPRGLQSHAMGMTMYDSAHLEAVDRFAET